jgi:hypothetical protein
MQQHVACGIDAHVQAVAAATVARLTREDVELWLSGCCMISPKCEPGCSRTVREPENDVKPHSVSGLTNYAAARYPLTAERYSLKPRDVTVSDRATFNLSPLKPRVTS